MSILRRTKRQNYVILASVAVLVFGLFATLAIWQRSTPTLNNRTVSSIGSIALDTKNDMNKNGRVDSGERLTFSIELVNKSRAEQNMLSVDTGVERKALFYIQNIKGATGLTSDKDTVRFSNVSILPQQTQKITFEALAAYGGKDFTISMRPLVLDKDTKQITQGKNRSLNVTAHEMPSMQMLKAQNREGN